MTRNQWLAFGAFAAVAVTDVVLGLQGPARIAVDGQPTRQNPFVSTVTASGEIVATRHAGIGSSVMGKIVSLPVAEGERVRAGQVRARIDAVQAESLTYRVHRSRRSRSRRTSSARESRSRQPRPMSRPPTRVSATPTGS